MRYTYIEEPTNDVAEQERVHRIIKITIRADAIQPTRIHQPFASIVRVPTQHQYSVRVIQVVCVSVTKIHSQIPLIK